MEILSTDQTEIGEKELVLLALDIDENSYDKILESRSLGFKNICSASLQDVTYQCYACSDSPYHAYCRECVIPEKHKGNNKSSLDHVVIHYSSIGGCCDCGDIQIMREESCCDKHQPENQTLPSLNILDTFTVKYRNFIQVSFALLFSKIEQIIDYPPNFEYNLRKAQSVLKNDELEQQITLYKEKLQQFHETKQEIPLLYERIARIMKTITDENIPFSLLTSQLLKETIDKDVQQLINLHHNQSNKIYITPHPQYCTCSILELLIKYYAFLQLEKEKFLERIFFNLQVDLTFKPLVARLLLQNFSNLYLSRQKFKFITQDKHTFKFLVNVENYSENLTPHNLFQIIKNKNYKEIIKVNYLKRNQIQEYFVQLQGAMMISLQQLINQPQTDFNFIMILCQKIREFQQFNIIQTSLDLEFQPKYVDICYNNLIFAFNPDTQKSLFGTDQRHYKKCLLILLQTSLFPCTSGDFGEVQLLPDKIKKTYQSSMNIQLSVLSTYKQQFYQIIQIWKDLYKSNQYVLQNLLRIILSYFLNNFTNQFELKGNIAIQDFLKNSIISDRNFITLLAVYISNFGQSCFYESLLNLCDNNSEQLQITMLFLLKRTILSYITFHYYEENQSYIGTQDSLQQTDLAYFQIYAFIFQEEGINNIISEYKNICTILRQPNDIRHLICKICQSDFEQIQCLGCYQGNELSNQIKKGIQKLFSTLFFAQNYYATKDLIRILRALNYNTRYNLENLILTSCEQNQDNDSLYLKKDMLPPLYEPVYAEMVKSLKDIIKDKLKTQNDSFTELFGNSLAQELKQNNPQSTLTCIRKEILKAIIRDNNQVLLQDILINIQQYQEKGELNKIRITLEQNAIYLNLLFQANKYIGQNEIIFKSLNQIKEICNHSKTFDQNQIFENFILLLNEQSVQLENQQITNSVQKQQIKKQQLLQRFNKMSQVFQDESQVQQKQEIICVKCQLPINEFEIQYKPVLLEFTNQHKYYCQANIQKDLELDILQVNTTCCGHLYHYKCLTSIRSKHKQGQKIYQCCICFASYNFYFMSPTSINDVENHEFIKNLEFVLNLIPKEKLQHYYQKYAKNNKLQMSLVVTELFSCSLFSLLLQLLSDINQFYERKNHLFLQEIIILLRLAYSENFVNILDQYPINNEELLYKLFRILINNASFKYFEKEYQQELENALINTQNQLPIMELITQSELKSQLYINIYDVKQFKQELRNTFSNQFGIDFKQFLLKYNLSPCEKKKCKYLPQYENGFQCICLICLKKMCSKNCGNEQNVIFGNLSRHSQKNHMNKSLFLRIQNSKIIVMQAPLVVYHNQTLFQNLIGEQSEIGQFKSDHYKTFKLNLKVVDWIVDTIIGHKYLNKIFADTSQIIKSNL